MNSAILKHTMLLADRITCDCEEVKKEIQDTEIALGIKPGKTKLIAVSKTKSMYQIKEVKVYQVML